MPIIFLFLIFILKGCSIFLKDIIKKIIKKKKKNYFIFHLNFHLYIKFETMSNIMLLNRKLPKQF